MQHGLIHALNFGQGRRLFELQPGIVWHDGSWLFSKCIGDKPIRLISNVACILATIGFVAAGAGLIASQFWWHSVTVASAVLSSLIFILFWDGEMLQLGNEGGYGFLFNFIIIV
ncbi:MAG: hypothetical protein WC236_13640 [Gallionellaceae bacterium]|jgi:hypothetical protein